MLKVVRMGVISETKLTSGSELSSGSGKEVDGDISAGLQLYLKNKLTVSHAELKIKELNIL